MRDVDGSVSSGKTKQNKTTPVILRLNVPAFPLLPLLPKTNHLVPLLRSKKWLQDTG